MKKRKSPIVLVSFLVVLVGVIVMFSVAQSAPQKVSAEEVRGESQQAPSEDAVLQSAKQVTERARKIPMMGEGPQIQIELPKPPPPESMKPQRNKDNATNSQWYAPQSAK